MRGLEGMAATQRKSVEQVALEGLRSLFDKPNSPEVLLRTPRERSRPSSAAVDDLEAAIGSARLQVLNRGTFDQWGPG